MEDKDAYNFSTSNCVVSLHADRNLSIIILISPLFSSVFSLLQRAICDYDIEIMALSRLLHRKNIKVLTDEPRDMARGSIVLNSFA